MACHDAGRLVGERLSTAIRRPSREIVLVGHRRSASARQPGDEPETGWPAQPRLRDRWADSDRRCQAGKHRGGGCCPTRATPARPRVLRAGFPPAAPALRRDRPVLAGRGRRAPTPWVLQPGGSEVHKRRDGRILVGRAFGFRVTRLHPGGRRDPTFGGDGSVSIRNPGIPLAEDMEIEQDGGIALTGKVFGGGPATVPDSSLPAEWNLGHELRSKRPPDHQLRDQPRRLVQRKRRAEDLAEVRGRRLLVVRAMRKPLRTGCRLVAGVVRYLPDGSPDPSFDGDGRLVIRRAQTNRSDNIVVAVQRRTATTWSHREVAGSSA